MRARDINLFRNDETHLSDIGIDVYLNTIQGALGSFLSSSGPRVSHFSIRTWTFFFSLSISEVFVGGLLAVSGFRPTHLAGSDKTTVGHNPTIVRELIFWYTFLWYHKYVRCIYNLVNWHSHVYRRGQFLNWYQFGTRVGLL